MVQINSSGLYLRALWQAYIKIKLASVGKVGLYVNVLFLKILIISWWCLWYLYLCIVNIVGQLVPEILARLSWLLRCSLRVSSLFQSAVYFYLATKKINSLCLQALNFIVISMFVFLGFSLLWACLILSHYVYISLSFSPEVRSLPPTEAQSAKLSLGRGSFQFMLGEQVQSQEAVLLGGMSGLQWSGVHGWHSFSRSDENLAWPCLLMLRASMAAPAPAARTSIGMILPRNLSELWHRKKTAFRDLRASVFSTYCYSEKRCLSSGV